jgi:hypothetical protein
MYSAVFAKPIDHLSVDEFLAIFNGRKFKFEKSLGGPINQLRRARRLEDALRLCLVAPHIEAAKRLYRDRYEQCRAFFRQLLDSGHDEDNLFYALGICNFENGDYAQARSLLKIAAERAYAEGRKRHIDSMMKAMN